MISEAYRSWKRDLLKTLPASCFLVTEGDKKQFPFATTNGFELEWLLDSVLAVNRSEIAEDEKKTILNKARLIALSHKYRIGDFFLKEDSLEYPLWGEHLLETFAQYESGEIRYKEKPVIMEGFYAWGKKLARAMNDSITVRHSETVYDEDEFPIEDKYDSSTSSVSTYEFEDGSVKIVKGNYSFADDVEVEYKEPNVQQSDEDVVEIIDDTVEIVDDQTVKIVDDGDDLEPDEEQIEESHRLDTIQNINGFDASGFIILEEVIPAKSYPNSAHKKGNYHSLSGPLILEEETDGKLKFKVPLFVPNEFSANGMRFLTECAENLEADMESLFKRLEEQEQGKRSLLDIFVKNDVYPDMQATHNSRQGLGNEVMERAAKVTAGYLEAHNGRDIFWIEGETIDTPAGQAVKAQIRENMLHGVSLVSYPTDFKKNSRNGLDVKRMHLIGVDFTNSPANRTQFKSNDVIDFQILN